MTIEDKLFAAPEGFSEIPGPSQYSVLIGPIYQKDSDPYRCRAIRLQPKHANNAGIVHGGMLMALADTVMGSAARGVTGVPSVTVRMTTDFAGPGRIGDWLVATGTVSRETRTLTFVTAELRAKHRLVMTASGVFRKIERHNA